MQFAKAPWALLMVVSLGCAAEPPDPQMRSADGGKPPALGEDAGGRPEPLQDAGADASVVDARVDEVRGPTAKREGLNYPFPQNRPTRCSPPAGYRNADVRAAYEQWKRDTVTSTGALGHLRVKRLANDVGLERGSTVSEGIAYGMLLAVYMGDQELFDKLWKYEQSWLDENGLMHWYIDAAGTTVLGSGAASDSDEDMAWALLMAAQQWGGRGSLGESYESIAKRQIDLIWRHEIHEGKLLKPGDKWGDWNTVNISYFAPSYYRAFAKATGNQGWLDVIKTVYDTIENALNEQNGNRENGLVPAWCTSEGEPRAAFGGAPTHYQYDSCRTPFRIALDYCLHGEPRAKAYVDKTSRFFAGLGVRGMTDGYGLNGAARPQIGGLSAAFVGPAGVGASADSQFAPFVAEAYEALARLNLLVGGEYYDESWTALSLLALTGNFVDYTQIAPHAP